MTYLHIYLIHVSVWITAIIAADIYKKGAPHPLYIHELLRSAIILGFIGAIASAHGHIHYLQYVKLLN